MWTNKQLKKNALTVLSKTYWMSFLVCLVAIFLGAERFYAPSFNWTMPSSSGPSSGYENTGDSGPLSSEAIMVIVIMIVFVIIGILIGIAFVTFVSSPVICGKNRFFMCARQGKVDFSNLFFSFKKGNYLKTVKTMFMVNLRVFLWSLLLIIPGIIKSFEYALVPYLISENPDMSTERAFEISKKTMDGEKMRFFLLGLSFIGWTLLAVLTCGIGLLFLNPYLSATFAEFYACMREKAINYGYAEPDELTDYAQEHPQEYAQDDFFNK